MKEVRNLQADALIVDLYMGSANEDAGFRWTVGGFWGAIADGKNDISGVAFNFTMIDTLAKGLHDAKVCPAPMRQYSTTPPPQLSLQSRSSQVLDHFCFSASLGGPKLPHEDASVHALIGAHL